MTAFTTLVNALFLVDKPVTSSIGLALRDNPIAMFEGAVGAQRLMGDAHPQFAAGGTVLDRVTHEGLAISIGSVSGGAGAGTLYSYYWSFTAIRSGSLRITFTISQSGYGTGQVNIKNNGSTVGNASGSGAKSVDVSFNAGDQITVEGGISYTNSAGTSFITNLRVQGDQRGTYRT